MTEYKIPMKDGKVDYNRIGHDILWETNEAQVFSHNELLKALYNHALDAAISVTREKDCSFYKTFNLVQAIRALKEPIE